MFGGDGVHGGRGRPAVRDGLLLAVDGPAHLPHRRMATQNDAAVPAFGESSRAPGMTQGRHSTQNRPYSTTQDILWSRARGDPFKANHSSAEHKPLNSNTIGVFNGWYLENGHTGLQQLAIYAGSQDYVDIVMTNWRLSTSASSPLTVKSGLVVGFEIFVEQRLGPGREVLLPVRDVGAQSAPASTVRRSSAGRPDDAWRSERPERPALAHRPSGRDRWTHHRLQMPPPVRLSGTHTPAVDRSRCCEENCRAAFEKALLGLVENASG